MQLDFEVHRPPGEPKSEEGWLVTVPDADTRNKPRTAQSRGPGNEAREEVKNQKTQRQATSRKPQSEDCGGVKKHQTKPKRPTSD